MPYGIRGRQHFLSDGQLGWTYRLQRTAQEATSEIFEMKQYIKPDPAPLLYITKSHMTRPGPPQWEAGD
jgi:hypothetical protein